MKRFKNILYFADGAIESCHALERAVRLARTNEARLTVMDVLEETESNAEIEKLFGKDVNRILQERREADLQELIASSQQEDEVIYCHVTSGVAFLEVIRAVIANGYDLVIKAARPPQGLGQRLFGSNDLHLLRKCPCPVWIDRPGAAYPYRNVLAAVDPLDEDGETTGRLVMDVASSLAGSEQAGFSVVHAWELQGESMLRSGRGRVTKTELETLLAATENRHRQALGTLLEHYGLEVGFPNIHLVKGRAAASIRAVSESTGSDLVVMATVGRVGIPGFFIGNTAEDVIQAINASVLAVKPEGFVSPVQPE